MAKIYWRTIKRGTRTFDSIPDELKEAVKALAQDDVKNGVIKPAEFKKLIGEAYSA